MAEQTYYRIGNLDSRVANVDQNLTEDVSKFCGMVAHLWSHISKPLLDIGILGLGLISTTSRVSVGPTPPPHTPCAVIFGASAFMAC